MHNFLKNVFPTDFTLTMKIWFVWQQIEGFVSQQKEGKEDMGRMYDSLASVSQSHFYSRLLFYLISWISHKSCREAGSRHLLPTEKSLPGSQDFFLSSLSLCCQHPNLLDNVFLPQKKFNLV